MDEVRYMVCIRDGGICIVERKTNRIVDTPDSDKYNNLAELCKIMNSGDLACNPLK